MPNGLKLLITRNGSIAKQAKDFNRYVFVTAVHVGLLGSMCCSLHPTTECVGLHPANNSCLYTLAMATCGVVSFTQRKKSACDSLKTVVTLVSFILNGAYATYLLLADEPHS